MSETARRRLVTAGCVLAFAAALLTLGAFSRSSASDAASTATSTGQKLPYAPWYWTMLVSRSNPDVLVLGTNQGLYRSEDGGSSWAATGPKGIHATSIVQAGDSILAGGVRTSNPNPVIRKGTGRTAPDGPAALASSADDGKTWKVLHPRGLPAVTVQALASDPKDDKSVYALLNNGKLYRSTDGAASFTLVSPRLGIAPWALAITNDGSFVGGDMDSGAFASKNGKAWSATPFKDSNGGTMVMEYAVQPGDSKKILMSSDGIMVSDDSGKTWRQAMKSTVMFGPIAFAPSASQTAYAVGFDDSLWRTDDAGKTWKKVS